MQKERKIQEDFYESLSDTVEYSRVASLSDHYFKFDKYTGVLTVVTFDEAGDETTRRFRLQPVKEKP